MSCWNAILDTKIKRTLFFVTLLFKLQWLLCPVKLEHIFFYILIMSLCVCNLLFGLLINALFQVFVMMLCVCSPIASHFFSSPHVPPVRMLWQKATWAYPASLSKTWHSIANLVAYTWNSNVEVYALTLAYSNTMCWTRKIWSQKQVIFQLIHCIQLTTTTKKTLLHQTCIISCKIFL